MHLVRTESSWRKARIYKYSYNVFFPPASAIFQRQLFKINALSMWDSKTLLCLQSLDRHYTSRKTCIRRTERDAPLSTMGPKLPPMIDRQPEKKMDCPLQRLTSCYSYDANYWLRTPPATPPLATTSSLSLCRKGRATVDRNGRRRNQYPSPPKPGKSPNWKISRDVKTTLLSPPNSILCLHNDHNKNIMGSKPSNG
jgi:hypothetical protein